MKTFIIHIPTAIERKELVDRIVKLTGANIFNGIIHEKGVIGCAMSHMAIYKQVPEGEDLMIFEDDCEVIDESFLEFVNKNKDKYDIIYIGVNRIIKNNLIKQILTKKVNNGSWGCHAMWISPKALKLYTNHKTNIIEVDNIWNEIEYKYKLKVLRPSHINKFVKQKPGLKSYITGRIRSSI